VLFLASGVAASFNIESATIHHHVWKTSNILLEVTLGGSMPPAKDIEIDVTPLRSAERNSGHAGAFNIEAELAALEDLADWLDSKFEIPGTGIRFGLDPILGLIPGIGDTLSAIPAGHIILSAHRLGAPKPVLLKMLANLGFDAVMGIVPVLGDLMDTGFKANRRNVTLLREHFGVPGEPRR